MLEGVMLIALRVVSRFRTSLVCRLARRARRLGPVGCRAARGVMRGAPAVDKPCEEESRPLSCRARLPRGADDRVVSAFAPRRAPDLRDGSRLEVAERNPPLSRAVSDRRRRVVEEAPAEAGPTDV